MKRTWCLDTIDSHFISRIEQILSLYNAPYDPAYPVICFDERSCFLIGDRVEPVRKEHYAYEKLGSCALLAALEPLTGRRLAPVHPRRTKREFCWLCQELAVAYFQADTIRLVLDNLNTHDPCAFYETLPAAEALALANRFESQNRPVGLI